MPVLINEVVAELLPGPEPGAEEAPLEDTMPLESSEHELMQALDLVAERRRRLEVD